MGALRVTSAIPSAMRFSRSGCRSFRHDNERVAITDGLWDSTRVEVRIALDARSLDRRRRLLQAARALAREIRQQRDALHRFRAVLGAFDLELHVAFADLPPADLMDDARDLRGLLGALGF